jgi:hypothetical protein
MSVRQSIIDTLFQGRQNPLDTALVQLDNATSPNGVVTAPIGTFLQIAYQGNAADYDVYINTNGTTSWSLVYDASTLGHVGT